MRSSTFPPPLPHKGLRGGREGAEGPRLLVRGAQGLPEPGAGARPELEAGDGMSTEPGGGGKAEILNSRKMLKPDIFPDSLKNIVAELLGKERKRELEALNELGLVGQGEGGNSPQGPKRPKSREAKPEFVEFEKLKHGIWWYFLVWIERCKQSEIWEIQKIPSHHGIFQFSEGCPERQMTPLDTLVPHLSKALAYEQGWS